MSRRANPSSGAEKLFMLVDPDTREALREGPEGPAAVPHFFTTEEAARGLAQERGLEEWLIHPVPAVAVHRMKSLPHFIDGERAAHQASLVQDEFDPVE